MRQDSAKEITESVKRVFPGVQIGELLGRGSFGCVHKAVLNLGSGPETVAIKSYDLKRIKTNMPTDAELIIQKIEDEIMSLSSLKSPSILRNYNTKSEPSTGMKHLVLDFCDGGDLEKGLFDRKSGYPQQKVKAWLFDLLDGFLELEAKNIYHRDVKPANLLLKNSRIILADFGVSKYGCPGQTFTLVGSGVFTAPEILMMLGHNSKADVWSLGVTLYMLLFGRDPWNWYDAFKKDLCSEDKRDKIQFSGPNLHFPDSPKISTQLKEIIQRMLVWEQNDRISWKEIQEQPYFEDELQEKLLQSALTNNIVRSPSAALMFQEEVNKSETPLVVNNKYLNQTQSIKSGIGSALMKEPEPTNRFVDLSSPTNGQHVMSQTTAANYFIYLSNCASFFLDTGRAFKYCASKDEIYHSDIWSDFGLLGAFINKVNLELIEMALEQILLKSQPSGIATSFGNFYNGPNLEPMKVKFANRKPEVETALRESVNWIKTKYKGSDLASIIHLLESPGFTLSVAAQQLPNKVAHVLSQKARQLNQTGELRDDTFLQVKQGLGRVYLCLTYQQAMEFRDNQKNLFDWKEFITRLNDKTHIDDIFDTASNYFEKHKI